MVILFTFVGSQVKILIGTRSNKLSGQKHLTQITIVGTL